jgi:hypothetical protein
MLELLIFCSIIIISRFAYGTVFTYALFVGIFLCVYITSVNTSIIIGIIVLITPIILRIRHKV